MTNDVRAMQLRSWTDGPVRDEVLDFVARITNKGGQDYVPPAARIAVFDNDGTLWCEQPLPVQAFFLVDRVKAMAAKDPSLRVRQPYKALLEQDMKTLKALGLKSIVEMIMATHAGMTQDAFAKIAEAWLATARHPRLGALCTDVTYRPQIELLAFLREHGFKTYIVTGGGIEFVRAFAEHVYGLRHSAGAGDRFERQAQIRGDGSGHFAHEAA
jgi:phosphoserine phosphatase